MSVFASPKSDLTVPNKICLVFPRVFWPIHIKEFGILSDEIRGKYFLIENLYEKTKLPCLLIKCSGEAALELENKEDLAIQKEVLTILSKMFPFECPLPYPIEAVITRWQKDQYKGINSEEIKQYDTQSLDPRIIWAGGYSTKGNAHSLHGSSSILIALDSIRNGRIAARKLADQLLGKLR